MTLSDPFTEASTGPGGGVRGLDSEQERPPWAVLRAQGRRQRPRVLPSSLTVPDAPSTPAGSGACAHGGLID